MRPSLRQVAPRGGGLVHFIQRPVVILVHDLNVVRQGRLASLVDEGHRAIDRFEVESAVFFERVRNRYLELAQENPARIRIVDATQQLEEVCNAALAALETALGLEPMRSR